MSGTGKRRSCSGRIASPPIQRDRSRSRQNSHAQYDGGPGSSGHRGMNSPPGSPRVASRSPPGTLTFGSIQGQMQGGDIPLRDPARDPRRIPKISDMCRNVDLPADALSQVTISIAEFKQCKSLHIITPRFRSGIPLNVHSVMKPLSCYVTDTGIPIPFTAIHDLDPPPFSSTCHGLIFTQSKLIHTS
ncbi:hypothetical protein PABG_02303 [Paracoccidioides brasiliensis Pb03]|nr:hypothetical protein PABG_02303 [Paracoccidioides brasiliensis Pb03]